MDIKRDVRLAGIVQGKAEYDAVERVLKSDWHVSGPECSALQKEFAAKVGAKYCVVVNSGSSANLLALTALNLPKDSRVLTSACGFPATLNPILHLGHMPVFVDYNTQTLQASFPQIEELVEKTPNIRAILLAHTLGGAFNIPLVMKIADHYNIQVIEDCCEALGTKVNNQHVGTFGKVGTFSFYSSHHISGFGGGGAIVTDDEQIYETCKSLRDWGKMNVREGYITTKLDSKVGDIPYDQQYTYTTIGHNARLPDVNCAYAREQLKRLDNFIQLRKANYGFLQFKLCEFQIPLILTRISSNINPSPFGYPIVLQHEGIRDNLVSFLEDNGIHIRLFFAGNILKHKPYKHLANGQKFPNADYLMRNAFFCGCWPGLDANDMLYIAMKMKEYFYGH